MMSRREDFRRNTAALLSLRPTGEVVKDAQALFEAADIGVNTLNGPDAKAIKAGDVGATLKVSHEPA